MTNETLKEWAHTAPLEDVIKRVGNIVTLLTAITNQTNFYTNQINKADTLEKAEVLRDLVVEAGEIYSRFFDEFTIYSEIIDSRKGEQNG